jgi:hypothetical protein
LSFELIAVVWKPIDEADLEATPRCIALVHWPHLSHLSRCRA